MNERWWCLDCRMTITLDIHGRCSMCGSNAVDSFARRGLSARLEPVVVTPLVATERNVLSNVLRSFGAASSWPICQGSACHFAYDVAFSQHARMV